MRCDWIGPTELHCDEPLWGRNVEGAPDSTTTCPLDPPPRPAPPRPRPQHTHTLGELRVRAPRGLVGLRSDCLGPAVMTQCGAAGKLALWVTHNGSTVPTKAACTLEFRAAWSLCRAPYSRNTHPYCDNTHPYSRKCTLIPEIHTLSNDNTHRCSRNTHPYSALPCSSR